MQVLSCFYQENLEVVSIVWSGEGFDAQLTHGSGVDS